MANVTKPIILDETGQAIKAAIKEGASIVIDKLTGGKGRSTLVYGFHIDGNEPDPYAAVTYLKDAVGMTPARMNYLNNKFSYGSWADAFFMPRPCMLKYDGTVDYYLDPNDYDKKENGEVSAIGDPTLEYGVKYQGNAMMEWGRSNQQIWTKVLPDADDPYSGSVYISNKQMDENYVAWPFVNNQGVLVNHFYTPIYNGSLTAYKVDNTTYYRLRSIPRRPVINSNGTTNNGNPTIPFDDNNTGTTSLVAWTIVSHEVRFALNNNPNINFASSTSYVSDSDFTDNRSSIGWFIEVYCDIQLINNLLILIGKSLDTQEVFGNGNMEINSSVNNGILYTGSHEYVSSIANYSFLNKSGLFWGSNKNGFAIKVFGMENWWGNSWRRYAGHIGDTSSNTSTYNHFIKNTFGTEDGSGRIGYGINKTGYIDTLCETIQGSNYVRSSKFINTITYGDKTYNIANFLPDNNGFSEQGSTSTYYCDYYAQKSIVSYALRGGRAGNNLQCGAFYVNMNNAYNGTSNKGSSVFSASLSFKPIT